MLNPIYPVMKVSETIFRGNIRSETALSLKLPDYEYNPQWHPRTLLDATGRLFPLISVERLQLSDVPLRGKMAMIIGSCTLLDRNTVWFQHTFGEPQQLTLSEAVDFLVYQMLKVKLRWKPDGPSIRSFRAELEMSRDISEITRLPYAESR